jgi:hypothetical protein
MIYGKCSAPAYRLLPTAYYLLPTAYCLLLLPPASCLTEAAFEFGKPRHHVLVNPISLLV